MPSFTDLLASRTVLLADGATGTNYQNMGIEPGVAPEEWVVDAPDKVQALHRRFRDAGLAREAVGDDVLVAGSLGPTGHLADPLGPLTHDLAVATFAEQARALD